MIIVIRGTNGSGKSHTVRTILAQGRKISDHDEGSRLIRLPRVKRPVLVIGPYIAGRSMGGCDCIRQPSRIYRLIDLAIAEDWHVLLEGVILATKPYLEYHAEGFDVRFMLLDPPIAVCLDHIDRRQKAKGHTSKLSKSAMKGKQERARAMFSAAKSAGMIAVRFDEPSRSPSAWVSYQLRRSS